MQQQHALFRSRARGFLVAFLVGYDGVCRVFLREVDISYGVVNLVEIVLVVVIACHSPEPAYHLLTLTVACKHLRHGNACVEGHLVRRVLTQHLAERLVGLRIMP